MCISLKCCYPSPPPYGVAVAITRVRMCVGRKYSYPSHPSCGVTITCVHVPQSKVLLPKSPSAWRCDHACAHVRQSNTVTLHMVLRSHVCICTSLKYCFPGDLPCGVAITHAHVHQTHVLLSHIPRIGGKTEEHLSLTARHHPVLDLCMHTHTHTNAHVSGTASSQHHADHTARDISTHARTHTNTDMLYTPSEPA